MSTVIGNEMIMASAGSGKTHALVTRYLRLLALGQKPARIIALTFTRKAAGEFLQQIFLRLTRAAVSEREAAVLSGDIHLPGGDAAFFRALLRDLVLEMGMLQLGTIDSFFARVVGAFPYELGLTRPHRIMDEIEQGMARRAAMEQLLAGGDDERENHVLQLYKQLTWGVEAKSVYTVFEEHLRTYHALYLENSDPRLWGDAAAIFGSGAWWAGKDEELPALLGETEEELAALGLKPVLAKGFGTLLGQLRDWQPGLDTVTSKLWDALLDARAELQAGRAEIQFSRVTLEIVPPLSGLLYRLLQHHTRGEITRKLAITRSIGDLLSEYDAHYDRSVRETGSLVFADLPMLLVKGLFGETPAFAAPEIIYRLDGQMDHWMIDEFQDTSRIQWKVISAFADEVLQDPSGRRSFFYVGDIKQSIYGWRGGDARLFLEVFNHYNRGTPGIRDSVLFKSWRSVPAVLDCVNTLFGDGFPAGLVGGRAAQRWQGCWARHAPSEKTAGTVGYAGWGIVDDKEQLAAACIDLVSTVDPLSKGLSCAILVRTNDEVTALAQALREAGIPASMEGVVSIARDNIAGTWLLAFLHALARPGEAFARAYLSFPGMPMEDAEFRRLAGLIRTVLTEDGYAEAVRRLLGYMETIIAPDPFLRRRSEQLLEAATRFEAAGMDGLEPFIRFLGESTVKEASLSTQVQVMTVHKAKGLGFDVVVVAGFGGSLMTGNHNHSMHVQRDDDGAIRWILDLPRKSVYAHDPVLGGAHAAYADDQAFEALCLLYVAMTRAKRGLYCLSQLPTRNLGGPTWLKLFEAAFGTCEEPGQEGPVRWQREWGDAAWYREVAVEERLQPQPVQLDAIRGPLPPRRPTLRRMASPSREAHGPATQARSLRSTAGRQFGTRMHDFLAGVAWVDPANPSAIEPLLRDAAADVADRFRRLLATEDGRQVFTAPAEPCRLWREKPYVLRKGDAVAQGVIDRAVVHLDGDGAPQRVVIYDYKTDVLDPARPAGEQLLERYALQIERYREAVAALTGLPLEVISAQLVPV